MVLILCLWVCLDCGGRIYLYSVTVSFVASGLAVASALVDISQQMPIAYKEKSGAIRNRKQQPPAQPGTCI